MFDKTLYELFKKKIPLSGGNSSGQIYEYVVIIIIVVCLIIFGPLIYKFLKSFSDIVDNGSKTVGQALITAGKITESMGYCYGGKTPSTKCDEKTLEDIKKTNDGSDGYNICNSCIPPCLINDIDCTNLDIFGILGVLFVGALSFASIYAKVKSNRGNTDNKNSVEEDLKNDSETVSDLTEGGEKDLKEVETNIDADPDGPEGKRARAVQDKKEADEKRIEADKKREEADKDASDKESEEKAKAAERDANEAEEEAEESKEEADDANEDNGELVEE